MLIDITQTNKSIVVGFVVVLLHKVWRLEHLTPYRELINAHVGEVKALSVHGQILYSGGVDGQIKVFCVCLLFVCFVRN